MDLMTFLREQLDNDEALARKAEPALEGGFPDYRTYTGPEQDTADEFLDRFNPARVLADIAVKRQIVDELAGYFREFEPIDYRPRDGQPWEVRVARILALPYCNHPDYNPEWKP